MRLGPIAKLILLAMLTDCSVRSEEPKPSVRHPSDAGIALALSRQMACVLSAGTATLQVDFGVRGCFGGSDNRLRLEKNATGFTADGFAFVDIASRDRATRASVPTETARGWIAATIAALGVDEVRGGCISTAKTFAHLTVQCDGLSSSQTFETHDCEGRMGFGEATYQHAFEITRIARAALDTLPKQKGPLTSAEEQLERRKWSGLYQDGLRVRHHPVEEWELDGG